MTDDPFERARTAFFGADKTLPSPLKSASQDVAPGHDTPVTENPVSRGESQQRVCEKSELPERL